MTEEKTEFIEKVATCLQYYHFSEEVANFVGCQFALESNFGLSNLAIDNKNYCGMRNPLVRISVAVHAGDPNYHWASYDSLISCVLDFVLCLQYHKPLSIDYSILNNYKFFIKSWYCPEKDYLKKVEAIYNQFINQQKS